MEDGNIWTGTDGSLEGTNEIYDGIIGAFERAIRREDEVQSQA